MPTAAQIMMLREIERREPVRVTSITAGRYGSTRYSAIKRLEADGYVRLEGSHGRDTTVVLTDEGRALLERERAAHAELMRGI